MNTGVDEHNRPTQIPRAAYARGEYVVRVDPQVDARWLLTAEFWARHLSTFRKNDIIDVLAGDKFEARLRVVEIHNKHEVQWPELRVLSTWPHDLVITPPPVEPFEYRVEFIDNHFRAITADGKVLVQGCASAEDCDVAMAELNAARGSRAQ